MASKSLSTIKVHRQFESLKVPNKLKVLNKSLSEVAPPSLCSDGSLPWRLESHTTRTEMFMGTVCVF